MPTDQVQTWPDGGLFIYVADITNGAGGAGTQSYTVTAPDGSEIEFLFGHMTNDEASSARTFIVTIDAGAPGSPLTRIYDASLNANQQAGIPHAGSVAAAGAVIAGGVRLFMKGPMRLVISIASVTLSEDTSVGLTFRCRGGIPTVVEAGASTPTITITEERML